MPKNDSGLDEPCADQSADGRGRADFNRVLRSEVRSRLQAMGESRAGGAAVLFKFVVLLVNLAGFYVLTLRVESFVGASLAVVGLSLSVVALLLGVMHDASHSAFSEHVWLNRLANFSLVVVGGSAISWHHEHVVRHHAHTNVLGLDSDLETGGLLRLHAGQPWRPLHQFQHLYAWLLYGGVSLKWIWFEDFDDVIFNRYDLGKKARLIHAAEVLLAKGLQVFTLLVVPSLVWGLGRAFASYILLFFVISVTTAVTFVVAHLSGVQAMPRARREAPPDWAEFQLSTTADFATQNRVLTWLLGGLNYQVEHHLFPHVSHRHYPWIRDIVRREAGTRGLRYHEFPSFWAALRGHFSQLSALGAPPSLVAAELEIEPSARAR